MSLPSRCKFRRGIYRRFVCLLLLATGPAGVAEQVDIDSLLKAMLEAEKRVSFDGTFVYQRVGTGLDDQMDTVRVVHHATEDGGVRERLVTLMGEPREVIRDVAGVRLLLPLHRYIVGGERHDALFTLLISRPRLALSRNYELSMEQGGRVAGRATWKLRVVPRDQYRYGHNLWLDKDSGLMLRYDTSNQSGEVLERLMFTRIEFMDDVSESQLNPEFSTEGFSWNEDAHLVSQKDIDDSRWRFRWVPDGFEKIHHERIHHERTDHEHTHHEHMPSEGGYVAPIEHLIFTDGLAMISVFIEREVDEDDFIRSLSSTHLRLRGSLYVSMNSLRGYQITTMGDVPEIAVRRMANSVEWDGMK